MNNEASFSTFIVSSDSAEQSKETKQQLLGTLNGIYRVVSKGDVERYLPRLAPEYKNLNPMKRFVQAFKLLVSNDRNTPTDLEEIRIFILDDFPDYDVAELVDGVVVLTSQAIVVDDCESVSESDIIRFPISDISFVDVVRGISQLLLDLATEKYNFKRWVSSSRLVRIPSESLVGTGGLHQVYSDVLSRIFEASLGVGMVIYAICEAVAIQAGEQERKTYEVGNISKRRTIEYHDAIAAKLGLSEALYEAFPGNEHVLHVHPTVIEGQPIGEIEKRMVMHLHFPGVGYVGRRSFPAKPLMSIMEQGMQKTKLENFSAFRMTKVGLVQHLTAVEDLLAKHDKTDHWIGSIRKRSFVERLSKNCLSQRLLQIL